MTTTGNDDITEAPATRPQSTSTKKKVMRIVWGALFILVVGAGWFTTSLINAVNHDNAGSANIFNDPAVRSPLTGKSPDTPAPLTGRTQLTLTPVAAGNEKITVEAIAESIRIIRKRLESSGVSGAEINNRGGSIIVVVLPRKPDQATLELLRKPGEMRFRGVLTEGSAAPVAPPAPIATAGAKAVPLAGTPKDASDPAWITPDVEAAYSALNCANPRYLDSVVDDPAKPMVTCSVDGLAKYILGPAEVLGSEVSNATAVQQSQGGSVGIWEIKVDFNAAGTKAFCDMTARLSTLPAPRSQFGIALDSKVLSAPVTMAALCAGSASLTGGFTAASAKVLAEQIRFGGLPYMFQVQTE